MAKAAELDRLPTTITAAVTNRLREEILDGDLPPGSRLRQAHIAESYGVSTTPVREAFAALEREGLIQSNAHRGVVVFEPSATELRDFYEIRIPLEALATERAAANLSDRELEKMAALLKRLDAANTKADWKLSNELNEEFHMAIYGAAQRPRLFKLIGELRASSRAYNAIFPTMGTEQVERSKREHQAIYDACVARKPKAARKAMIAHLQHTVDVVGKSLDDGDAS